jgi:methionyl-tRNA formyltransferase
MHAYNIVFAGTPEFSAQHLRALLDSPHSIKGVYTQPDRAAGRGKQLQASAVKKLALEAGLPVYQPQSLKGEQDQQVLTSLGADLLIVVAYGLILPQAVLDIPPLGCLNVHASLLPRWRGAAPIERALLAGDTETGVTIMQMDKGLDTGAMLSKVAIPIRDEDDRQTLESRLAEAGTQALIDSLTQLPLLQANAQTQDNSLSTYAAKLEKDEALIDWSQSAAIINRTIRGGIGRNPAYCFLNGERVRIVKATPLAQTHQSPVGMILEHGHDSLRVACNGSVLEVQMLQFPGKTVQAVTVLLNSRQEILAPGNCFRSHAEAPT